MLGLTILAMRRSTFAKSSIEIVSAIAAPPGRRGASSAASEGSNSASTVGARLVSSDARTCEFSRSAHQIFQVSQEFQKFLNSWSSSANGASITVIWKKRYRNASDRMQPARVATDLGEFPGFLLNEISLTLSDNHDQPQSLAKFALVDASATSSRVDRARISTASGLA